MTFFRCPSPRAMPVKSPLRDGQPARRRDRHRPRRMMLFTEDDEEFRRVFQARGGKQRAGGRRPME